MYTHTHTHTCAGTHAGQCSVHCDTQQRNGAAEHFLIIMRQPAVLARAREEGRQGKSMGLTCSNMYAHARATHTGYLRTSCRRTVVVKSFKLYQKPFTD